MKPSKLATFWVLACAGWFVAGFYWGMNAVHHGWVR